MLTTKKIAKNIKFILLILIGFISIFGKLISNEKLVGLGFITAASPLPLVFSSYRGVEGFALSFSIDYEVAGKWESLEITSKVYEKLIGPYNRRNAYGAAIAGAPMLIKENEAKLIKKIHEFALCKGPLSREFGIKADVAKFIVHIKSNTKDDNRSWKIPTNCHD